MQELNQSDLFLTADGLITKGIPGSGSCPAFNMEWEFFGVTGSFDFSSYCWIFDILKAFVIISAFAVARAIIFGG
jgi:hypothetical protein